MKESAKKYIWLTFKRKKVIDWNDAREIENRFFAEYKDILKPLIIKEFCPFCEKEIDECSCGAKAVYWDGGYYCPMCESTHYYIKDKEILDEIAEIETPAKSKILSPNMRYQETSVEVSQMPNGTSDNANIKSEGENDGR